MMSVDEDALLCDFAETYRIYDLRALPVRKLAVLACGLRDDSRIMMRIRKQPITLDTMLAAGILDRLGWLVWMCSRNKPQSVLEQLLAGGAKKDNETLTFASGDDFEKARRELLERMDG